MFNPLCQMAIGGLPMRYTAQLTYWVPFWAGYLGPTGHPS